MTANEAVFAGRPVITNAVVPSLELLRPSCIEAKTNDQKATRKPACNPAIYEDIRSVCAGVGRSFYDRRRSA
jgi:hypothetical protein